MPEGFRCDLVKIDVEGHELQVLRGMKDVLANSPQVKVLFEKLEANAANEADISTLLGAHGMAFYGVGGNATLVELGTTADLQAWRGYIVAARQEAIGGVLDRSRFRIYPGQLNIAAKAKPEGEGAVLLSGDDVLFYGPYWFLRRGTWRLRIHGELDGGLRIDLSERFGWKIMSLDFDSRALERDFICERDLVKFECVARPAIKGMTLRLKYLELVRLG